MAISKTTVCLTMPHWVSPLLRGILEELSDSTHREKEALGVICEGLEAVSTVERNALLQAVEEHACHANMS